VLILASAGEQFVDIDDVQQEEPKADIHDKKVEL